MRPIFAVLIALATVLAPFGMQSGSARAAMPSHHAQAIDARHCGGEERKADHSANHSCCAAMCGVAALAPTRPADLRVLARGIDRPAPDEFRTSYLAKLPTPPPRIG